MQVYQQKKALQECLSTYRKQGKTIGLVPTMGALHEGHLSLLETAAKNCDCVVISIFVNPTQFNNADDLKNYPRTLANDTQLLADTFPEAIIFSPTEQEMYGEQLASEQFDFGPLAQQMEGKYRNGHFDGVGTIVKRFFEIVQPDKAFFGEKDYQQLLIIKKLVSLTKQKVNIVGCPISREENGLARSSRNKRLSAEEREHAGKIYAVLQQIQQDFNHKTIAALYEQAANAFQHDAYLNLEYFEIADAENLSPATAQDPKNTPYRAFIAVYAKDVRLIDNIALN